MSQRIQMRDRQRAAKLRQALDEARADPRYKQGQPEFIRKVRNTYSALYGDGPAQDLEVQPPKRPESG